MIRNERQTWKTNFKNTKLQRINEGNRVMPAVRGHKLGCSREEVEAHRWQAGTNRDAPVPSNTGHVNRPSLPLNIPSRHVCPWRSLAPQHVPTRARGSKH